MRCAPGSTPPPPRTWGASLRGADLSYRDLAEVDLTGADLTNANLVEANLTGAELRDAVLDGARLDRARLVSSDLSGADLTRARLRRTDLTGAVVTGSRWTRAALIDVRGVPDAPELASAAVAPGSPVGTELAPATIGVRHGFHAGLGRLPQALAYGPDGGTLAIGGDDGGVLVCGTVSGRPLRTLQGHTGRVFAVVHGRDVLVTGSSDGRCDCGTRRPGRCATSFPGTASGRGRSCWVLRRTSWPPGTRRAPCGCGTSRPASCATG